MTRLILASLTALCCGTALYGTCVQISGDTIQMADLARAIPAFSKVDPAQRIGYAPAPGVQRVFTVREIGLLCRRFGIESDLVGTADVCLERETKPLSEEQISEAIGKALGRSDVRVEVVDFIRSALPPGVVEFTPGTAMRPPVSQLDAPTIWRGVLRTESGHTFSIWAKMAVTVETPVVMAARRIAKGEAIQAGDVKIEAVKYSPLFDPYLRSLELVEGKVVKQDIEAGRMIGRAQLEEPKDVLAGQYAHVDAGSGMALISFDGQVQTTGKAGDTVLVQNPVNGRSFRALVVGKGRVQALGGAAH